MSTIADYVAEAVTPLISRHLISDEALSGIRRLSNSLPGPLTDFFGFECTLPVEGGAADFLVCCRNLNTAWQYLAGNATDWDLPLEWRRHQIWRRVTSFARVWTAPQSPLFHTVHNVWLEFDIDKAYETPSPNIFLGSYALHSSGRHVDLLIVPEHCNWLIETAIPLLLDHDVSRSVRQRVARCLNLLPEDANIFQVGLMLARVSDGIRLCVRGLAGQRIAQYLNAIEWNACDYELVQLLDTLSSRVARIDLDIDVTNRVLSTIGLECYLKATQVSGFLKYLIDSGWCTFAKAEGIEQWQELAGRRPPDSHLKALRPAFELSPDSIFVPSLHHLKLVFSGSKIVNCKAYLGVHHKRKCI